MADVSQPVLVIVLRITSFPAGKSFVGLLKMRPLSRSTPK